MYIAAFRDLQYTSRYTICPLCAVGCVTEATCLILPTKARILHTYPCDYMKSSGGKALLAVTAQYITIGTRVWYVACGTQPLNMVSEHCYLKPVSNLKKLHLLYCHTMLLPTSELPDT